VIKVNTNGFGGKRLSKQAVVHTDDQKKPRQTLVISGQVEAFAVIRPKRVVLRGMTGTPIKGFVTVVPKDKYPFKIVSVEVKNGKNIRYNLSEVQQQGKKGYLLVIENLQSEKGRFFDKISLKTNSSIKPEISIAVYGDIRDTPDKDRK
jgi:hypothetical protein